MPIQRRRYYRQRARCGCALQVCMHPSDGALYAHALASRSPNPVERWCQSISTHYTLAGHAMQPLERARVRQFAEMINSGIQPLQNLAVLMQCV